MDRVNHELHLNFSIRKLLHNKYNDFLLAEIFKLLSLSMISLFIPIYLLNIGFSLLDVIGFEIVAISLGIIMCIFVLKFIIPKLNIKKSLIYSYSLYIFFYVILMNSDYFLNNFNKYFYLSLILFFKILPSSLYWMSHHLYFVKATKKNNTGNKLGVLMSIPSLIGIISPFLGSVLISKGSYFLAFIVSTIFMILASWSLMFSSDIKIKKHNISWKKVFDFKNRNKNKLFVIQGINDIACAVIWPILLFIMSFKVLSMGLIYLISNAAYSFTSYIVGKKSDIKGNHFFLRIGSIGHSFSLIFRALSTSILTITSAQSLGGIFGGIMAVSLDGGFYRNAHNNPIESILNREFYLHFGRAWCLLILFVLVLILPSIWAFSSMIIFAGFCTFMLSFIIKRDHIIIT